MYLLILITFGELTKNMLLLTKELQARFKEIGSQENVKDPIVVVKFFNPTGIGTWFATEYDPLAKMFFGYVSLFNTPFENEWGWFGLDEPAEIDCGYGLGIERDLLFTEAPISEVKKKYNIA